MLQKLFILPGAETFSYSKYFQLLKYVCTLCSGTQDSYCMCKILVYSIRERKLMPVSYTHLDVYKRQE